MEYKSLIKNISTHLKSLGWKKHNNTFYIEECNNFGVINFQKSLEHTNNSQKFTINLGVISTYILNYLNKSMKYPDIWECHWRERIGFLMTKPKDIWWNLNSGEDISDITNNIIDLLNSVAIPKILFFSNDEVLENLWINEKSGGLTEFEIKKYLRILQKKKKNEVI